MKRTASSRREDAPLADEPVTDRRADELSDWVSAALLEQAARSPGRSRAKPGTGAPETVRRKAPKVESDAVAAATAASERRAIETAAKTAVALGSVATWIERAQERLTETTQAASRNHESVANAVNRAVGSLGERLDDIERKVTASGASSLDAALTAIARLESKLEREIAGLERLRDEEPAAAAPDAAPIRRTDFDEALRGFDERIAELRRQIASSPRPLGRRALSRPDEVRGAVAAIRAHRAALDDVDENSSSAPTLAPHPAATPAAVLHELRSQMAALAGQIAQPEPSVPHDALPGLRSEIEALRRSLDGVASRSDLERLERMVAEIAGSVSELRSSGQNPSIVAAEIEALQGEIRALADSRSPDQSSGLQRDVDVLSHKLDIVAASGIDPDTTGLLSQQLDEIRDLLDGGAAAPAALSDLAGQLAGLRREIAEVGERQVDPEAFSSLRDAVETMRFSFEGAESSRPDRSLAPDHGPAIETMLASLVEKLDRVERKVADPEALDQLERQVEAIASRMVGEPARDPAIAALERSMGELMREVTGWRENASAMADHAAQTAIAAAIGSQAAPTEVAHHLAALTARWEASEERTRDSLALVQSTLDGVVGRIAILENGRSTRPAGDAWPSTVAVGAKTVRAENRPVAPTRDDQLRALAQSVSRTAIARAESSEPAEADIPVPPAVDEVLLEPGSGVPGRNGKADPAAAEDIKTSFIAAARRAYRAASVESGPSSSGPAMRAKAAGAMLTGAPSDLMRRVRTLVTSRRRPLLLGAAAVLLALGTLQLTRSLVGSSPEKAVVAAGAPSAAPPAKVAEVAPPAPVAAQSIAVTSAPSAPAAKPAPDPETTQSISTASVEPPPVKRQGVEPVNAAADKLAVLPTAAAMSPLVLAGATRSVASDASTLPPGLRAAATAGNPAALFELGARTAEGRGLPRDPKGAAALFEKAAEKELAPAQYRLGNLYERGVGVARDVEQARAWYKRAAENGNVRAMHNLAVLIAEGGGKPDYPAAVAWFQKAADHGVRDSQFNLAVLYARGLGVPQDFAKAYHWLGVAAGSGDEDAGRKRDEVGAKLPAADLARAKAGVERWKPAQASAAANEVSPPANGWPDAPIKRASR